MEYYKKNKYLLFSLALIFSGFLSLKSINDNLINPIQAITIFTILLYIVLSKSFNRTSNLFLKNYVLLFMLFPWISIIPAYFSHSQTPIESAHVLFNITGIFLLYLHLFTHLLNWFNKLHIPHIGLQVEQNQNQLES